MPSAQTVDLPKRLPLIVDPQNRGESTALDGRLVNAYVERRQSPGGEQEYWLYQRPGLSRYSQPSGGSATGRGVYNWLGDIYSICGGTIYKNGSSLASVDTTNGVYRFSQCKGGTPKLQFGNGVKAYNYDGGAGVVQITDVDFPTSFVKGWAYLDATTYVMSPTAVISGSDLNDPTNWSALNQLTAQIQPDLGKALAMQLVYVIAFKEWSTEVFYDAQNASGSPLGTVQGAKVEYGCVSADSVQDIDGNLFWVSQSRSSSLQVIQMTGLKAEPVSTKPVERLLSDADYSTVYSFTMRQHGHKFYVLTLKNSNLTLAYDMTEKLWTQWTDVNGNYLPIVSSTFTSDLQTVVQHESNGRLYYMDTDYPLDDTDVMTVEIITPPFDGGTGRGKTCFALEVVADIHGTVHGNFGAPGNLQVRTNDFDYHPAKWTSWREINMRNPRKRITGLGSFVTRAHHFRYKSRTSMPRIRAVELQLDVGTL